MIDWKNTYSPENLRMFVGDFSIVTVKNKIINIDFEN
jgi:hypothetical protein